MKHERLVAALRLYGASHVQLTRAFADSLGLHPTDAAALSEIIHAEDRGEPTSPAALATTLALSKPALSACLNRLELAELVMRCRESTDRRVLTLRCNPRIYEHVGRFFTPISRRMESAARKLSAADVAVIEEFLKAASSAIKT